MTTAMTYSLDDVQKRVNILSAAFDELLDLVPLQYLLAKDDQPEEKLSKRAKLRLRDAKKELKNQAKRAKLDPDNQKSIQDLQMEQLRKREEQEQIAKELINNNDNQNEEDSSSGDEMEEDSDDCDFEDLDESNSTRPELKPINVMTTPSTSSVAELRQKLHDRIEHLRSQRKLKNDDNRERQIKKTQEKRQQLTNDVMDKPESYTSIDNEKNQIPTFNKIKLNSKEELPKSKKRSAVKELKTLEMKKRKLEDLKKTDLEEASKVEKDNEWEKALKKADGEKIKDDAKLLKKSIKREKQKKAKSSAAWEERKNQVNKEMADKQQKRNDNLNKRKEGAKNKGKGKTSMSKNKAKPSRAGFEGNMKGGKKK